jgi:SAM-dependent methyltransferase
MAKRDARITPDFNSLARIYRWMEYLSFGPMLERCRFQFLSACVNARRALVLGDGDGRFTARLLATNSSIQIDAVDASISMLAQLEIRARQATKDAAARLNTFHADLRCFTPALTGYDLVVSHFFLDCLTDEEVAALVRRTVPHLTPDVTWLVSEFAIPPKGWRRICACALVRFLYFAFDKMTQLHVQKIPDYGRILASNGFQCREQATLLGGLLVAEVWKGHDGSL